VLVPESRAVTKRVVRLRGGGSEPQVEEPR